MSTRMSTDPDQVAVTEARPMNPTPRPGRVESVLARGRVCFGAVRSIADRRRMATGALALGLMLATTQPAWAIN